MDKIVFFVIVFTGGCPFPLNLLILSRIAGDMLILPIETSLLVFL